MSDTPETTEVADNGITGVANPDDPTLNTYDQDNQASERPYPAGKPRPERPAES